MQIKSLYAKNYRNILDEKIQFQKGINVLYGMNASGKTNALEAIYLFASGKSLRGSPEKEFIMRGKDSAKIALEFTDRKSDDIKEMSLSFLGNNRKIIKYGYSDITKMSELIGHFRACSFTPDDLLLVKGSPEERRRFADISISQISPRFVHCLNEYFKLLSQKNAMLKKAQASGKIDSVYIDIINYQLAQRAGVIVKQRNGFCRSISEHAKRIYGEISDDRESFGMKYISQTKVNLDDEEYTKKAYIKLFEMNLEREIKYGMSLLGPHKDDIYFYVGKNCDLDVEKEDLLFHDGFTAKAFGSRGQQRSVVLSLKLAQGELFRELCGEYPVFLLDDVFSELDSARRNYILSNISDKQIIITCCDCDIFGDFSDFHAIHAEEGKYDLGNRI